MERDISEEDEVEIEIEDVVKSKKRKAKNDTTNQPQKKKKGESIKTILNHFKTRSKEISDATPTDARFVELLNLYERNIVPPPSLITPPPH